MIQKLLRELFDLEIKWWKTIEEVKCLIIYGVTTFSNDIVNIRFYRNENYINITIEEYPNCISLRNHNLGAGIEIECSINCLTEEYIKNLLDKYTLAYNEFIKTKPKQLNIWEN